MTPTNQPLSLYLLFSLAPIFALSWLEMVCALPVFPAKSIPGKRALGAVPIGGTTAASASVMVIQFSWSRPMFVLSV